MSRQQPGLRLPVGVVVERRRSRNPWIDFVWQPVAALPGVPDTAPWTVLTDNGDTTTFYAGASEVELFSTSSEFYRDNLASGQPMLWVVLRPTEVEPSFEVIAVTADPNEGEAFTQAGNDLVEAVAMPASVREAVELFVAAHNVEAKFFKRRRDQADPEALARRTPVPKRDDDD